MDLYLKKRRWKILILFTAIVIGLGSLVYTNWITSNMAEEERKKAVLLAEAIEMIALPKNDENTSNNKLLLLPLKITQDNTTIPIIIVDEQGRLHDTTGAYYGYKNIKFREIRKEVVLQNELKKMKKNIEPIIIDIGDGQKQYLYYRESYLLRNLRLFPLVQIVVIFVFIGIAYYAFSASRKAEQNQVWVGMSKETAHQLGTPISALMAWVELLKLKNIDEALIHEFEKDIHRLEKITERFSKIGSAPELLHLNIIKVLNSTISYLQTRFSNKVIFKKSFNENDVFIVPVNVALFSWVIENLCKNAIDAMENNKGEINISVSENSGNLIIDVADTGKGIPKSQFKTIFQPGYSTKKRGWGLGLSLAKRIIEMYHKGKIFIKQSEIKKGTTFRIVLKKGSMVQS